MAKFRKLICAALLSAISVNAFCAPKSAGCVFGLDRMSLCWQQKFSDNRAFWEIGVAFHYAQPAYFSPEPSGFGGGASFCYNIIFASSERPEGRINWYGGPGFYAGYAPDRGKPYGLVAGLLGNIGLEYIFSRSPFTVSLCVCPLFASHLRKEGGNLTLTSWEYGYLFSLCPKVGIRYRF